MSVRAGSQLRGVLRRGVDIRGGQDVSILRHLPVQSEMRREYVTLPPGAGVAEVISTSSENPSSSVFVVDDDRRLSGVIVAQQSRRIMSDPASLESLVIAQDIMQGNEFPVVTPTDTLADVMTHLARCRGEVPVVEDGRLIGVVWPEDVFRRYNAEVFKRDMASSMVSALGRTQHTEPLPGVEGTGVAEINVPVRFVGKSLGSLDVRKRCGVTVLLVKRRDQAGNEVINASLDAEYVFQCGDVMLLMGTEDRLRVFERTA